MNRRSFVQVSLALACLAGSLSTSLARAAETQELVVFGAASLREVFQGIALTFEKQHPNLQVRFNFAGSQDLRVQIEHGAKVDVFASADWMHMKLLATQGMVTETVVFAHNLPVVVVPKNSPTKLASFADLSRVAHLVVGAPEVPIGAYTESILTRAENIYGKAFGEKVRASIRSRELNVRQVLTKVAMGEADAGIVYKTDALTMLDKVEIVEIPIAINTVAEYPIAVLKAASHADMARSFVELVMSKSGQAMLGAAGFGPPEQRRLN